MVKVKLKLKPCPFCGANAAMIVEDAMYQDGLQRHIITCTNLFGCAAQVSSVISRTQPDYKFELNKLEARWNRRT